METRANYVAVGLFTLLAVLAGFGFVYWTAGIGAGGETAQLRVRIPGSASGLGRGSFVLFNGVKVGDVRRVYIDVSNPTVAIADAEIDRLTPITRATLADIGLAGLTGQANIELKGGDPSEENLLKEAEEAGTIAEITANPSAVTNLLQTAQQIFTRADAVLDNLEGFVTDVRAPLTQTVRNVETFSDALGRNAEGIDEFLANFGELSKTLGSVSTRLESTLASAEEILDAVDREKIGAIVGNVETFTDRLQSASANFEGVIAKVDQTVESVRTLADNASGTLSKAEGAIDGVTTSISTLTGNAADTLGRVDGILDGVDPATVRTALANIEGATVDARRAAADFATVTEKFSARSEDIDRTISDAQQLAERLNQASVRVDGILLKVDNLLGSGEAEGVMAEASETLKSFRQVADTLNARIGPITDGLARFSGQGLRDAEALIRDARRSVNRIERAITDLERNPQRIITGGDGAVRQFDGRARR